MDAVDGIIRAKDAAAFMPRVLGGGCLGSQEGGFSYERVTPVERPTPHPPRSRGDAKDGVIRAKDAPLFMPQRLLKRLEHLCAHPVYQNYRDASLIRNDPPFDPTVGLCLGACA